MIHHTATIHHKALFAPLRLCAFALNHRSHANYDNVLQKIQRKGAKAQRRKEDSFSFALCGEK